MNDKVYCDRCTNRMMLTHVDYDYDTGQSYALFWCAECNTNITKEYEEEEE